MNEWFIINRLNNQIFSKLKIAKSLKHKKKIKNNSLHQHIFKLMLSKVNYWYFYIISNNKELVLLIITEVFVIILIASNTWKCSYLILF